MPAGSSRPFAGGGFFIVGVPPEAAKYFRRPGDGGQVDFFDGSSYNSGREKFVQCIRRAAAVMKKEWAAEKQKSGRRMILGAAAAVGSCLACTFADMFIKWLPAVSSGELTFFRGVFGVLFLLGWSLKTKERIIGGGHKTLLCLRGLLGGLGLYFFILSVQGLTLGDCQILAQLSAFFMCLLSPIFLKEKLPRKAVPGLFAIAAGTLCVLQVWNFSSFNVYSLYGLLGAFFSAAAYVVIGKLAEKGMMGSREIVLYFQMFCIFLGWLLMDGEFSMPSGTEWLWIAGMSFFALVSQVLVTWAFQHMNSVVVSFLLYFELLFHIFFGWAVWDEILSLSSVTGGLMIMAGSALLILHPRKMEA